MPQNSFQLILGFLYFIGNVHCNPHDPYRDLLIKVQPVIDTLQYLSIKSFFCRMGDWDLNDIFPTKDLTEILKDLESVLPLCSVKLIWNSFVYIGKDAIETDEEKEMRKSFIRIVQLYPSK